MSCVDKKFSHYSCIFLLPILLNSFKYEFPIFNRMLTKLSRADVIRDISVKNSPDCIMLDNSIFKDFLLADRPFEKALKLVYQLKVFYVEN